MSLFSGLLALCLPFAIAGGLSLWQYAVGRVVPETSLCRACRFDLKGLSAAASCPECGKSLSVPGAIVPLRVRSRSRLWLGIFLTGLPLCAAIAVLAVSVSQANFASVKPFWVLKAEALHGAPAQSAEALTEINRRIRADSIAADTWAPLVADAIQRRRTPSAPWNRGWSEFIELGRARAKVTDAQWTDYVRCSILTIEQHRKKLRQGAEAKFFLTVQAPYLSATTIPGAPVRIRSGMTRGSLNDVEFFNSNHSGSLATLTGNGSSGTGIALDLDSSVGIMPLKLTYRFDVLDSSTDKIAGTWEQDFFDSVEVIPPGGQIIEARTDASLVPAVHQSIRPSSFRIQPDGPPC